MRFFYFSAVLVMMTCLSSCEAILKNSQDDIDSDGSKVPAPLDNPTPSIDTSGWTSVDIGPLCKAGYNGCNDWEWVDSENMLSTSAWCAPEDYGAPTCSEYLSTSCDFVENTNNHCQVFSDGSALCENGSQNFYNPYTWTPTCED
ncbi:hypothetical protein GW916_09485 [bacterium]|nr:hypothetical protein [bacterium]